MSDIRKRDSVRQIQREEPPQVANLKNIDEAKNERVQVNSEHDDEIGIESKTVPITEACDDAKNITESTHNESTIESSRFQKIIHAGQVLGRFTQAGETSMESLTSLGRRKISEFYQKLSVNRIRYSEVKEKRMEAKRILQEVKDGVQAKECEKKEESDDIGETSQLTEIAPFPIEDDFLAYPDVPEESGKGSWKRMGIGDIGRSSSVNPGMKRKALSEIGRRFSELDDEHDRSNLLVNERNSSYPDSKTYSSFNTSSLTIKSDPGHLNNPKSLPASPTPHLARKGAPEEAVRHHPSFLHDMSIQV